MFWPGWEMGQHLAQAPPTARIVPDGQTHALFWQM